QRLSLLRVRLRLLTDHESRCDHYESDREQARAHRHFARRAVSSPRRRCASADCGVASFLANSRQIATACVVSDPVVYARAAFAFQWAWSFGYGDAAAAAR